MGWSGENGYKHSNGKGCTMPYIYQSEIWCDECGLEICEHLKKEGLAPANPEDESSYDSDEYPKYASDSDESDSPQHYAAGELCENAIELPSGRKVGLLFGELTRDGVQYVKQAILEASNGVGSKEVTELWREYYTSLWYDLD